MPLAEFTQNLIHKLEVGAGQRYLRNAALLLGLIMLVLRYDLHCYRNLSTPEGMDTAQLARNLADGKGYTTLYLRPLSLYLVQTHNEAGTPVALTNANYDFANIKTAHPDLANPPVYPGLLAGWMKILPFHYPMDMKGSFWTENGQFARYQPDFLIAVFNQILLLAAAVLTFFLARRLFDTTVAWIAAILVIGSELLWRFSISGLSTMLLLVIFLGLTWCLVKIEELAREPEPRPLHLLSLALSSGILTGCGALTRYSFGWVLVPVLIFLMLFSGRQRWTHALVALGAFGLILVPWVARNFVACGLPFGTASFAMAETSFLYPQFDLERAIHPDLTHVLWLTPYIHKLLANGQTILTNDLTRFGGPWLTLLFWIGLLVGFRSEAARRLRYFLLMCLGTFVLVQIMGQTQLSVESPEVNSENLLVLLMPLVVLYAISLFLALVDQMSLPTPQLRYPIIGAFVGLACLPMIFALLPSKTSPLAYPPYYPPFIRQAAGWMKQDELMMSDVPWAVAWYGQRQCVWLTLNSHDDFNAIHLWMKPIVAVYLSPETMNGRYASDWAGAATNTWGSFLTYVVTQNQVPPDFPLHMSPKGFPPEHLLVTDVPRWIASHEQNSPPRTGN